jgi:hypothetical protein
MVVNLLTSLSLNGMDNCKLGHHLPSQSNHILTGPKRVVAGISSTQLGCSWFATMEMELTFCVIGGATEDDDMALHPQWWIGDMYKSNAYRICAYHTAVQGTSTQQA